MSNEIDDLRNQINQTTKQLKSFESALSKNTRSSNIFDNAMQQSANSTKELSEIEKELSKTISGTMSNLTGFAKSLSNGQGSFAPLTAAMSLAFKLVGKVAGMFPIVGKALQDLATGAGEVATHMVESFDKAYSTFEKISDSGVVTSFTDMKQTARGLNLNFAQTETLLTKHSKNLALFAGSAVRGRQEFEKIAFESSDTRRKFQKLGISSEEFSEMQANYLNQQMRMGQGQKKTTEEMAAGSIKYIKELDTISKLTGMSKKDLQSGRDARMNDAKFRAGFADAPEKIVDNVHTFLDLTSSQSGKQMELGMREYLSSGNYAGEQAGSMIASFGDSASEAMQILSAVRKGEMQAGDARTKLNIIHEKAGKAAENQAATYGEGTIPGRYMIEHKNAAMHIGKDTQQLMDEENARKEKELANTTSENAKQAETKQALEQAGRDIEQMSTSSKLVTFLMNSFATGMELVTEKLYEMSGEDLPAHLKAKKEERKALEAESEARKKLKEAESGKTGKIGIGGAKGSLVDSILGIGGGDSSAVYHAKNQLEAKIKEAREATERRIAAEKAAGIGSLSSTSTEPSGGFNATRARLPGDGEEPKSAGESGGVKLSTIRSKSGASTSVATEFAKNFQGLINWFDDQGYKIKSLGGYADRNIAGTNTPSYHSRGAAIDINPAENPMGSQRITDMPEGTRQAAKSMGLGWGLDWPNKSDAMHFSAGKYELGTLTARTGGIFSGPESGYMAELHGDESVSPAGNEGSVSKSALGSGSMMTNSSNKITEMFNNLFEKMDTLIELSDISMNNQQEFLEAKLG
jgi:hypothetical protein